TSEEALIVKKEGIENDDGAVSERPYIKPKPKPLLDLGHSVTNGKQYISCDEDLKMQK
ncbi:12616_t:CDS:2, partial [Entrophospora sp. SA101]